MEKDEIEEFFVLLRRHLRHSINLPVEIREQLGYAEGLSVMTNGQFIMLAWTDPKGEQHSYRFDQYAKMERVNGLLKIERRTDNEGVK